MMPWVFYPAQRCTACGAVVSSSARVGEPRIHLCHPCAFNVHRDLELLRQGNPFDWPPRKWKELVKHDCEECLRGWVHEGKRCEKCDGKGYTVEEIERVVNEIRR